tara:strand:- start:372 stop:539 length:168 start_codon:yes stop_codon:yes gene_type:complete
MKVGDLVRSNGDDGPLGIVTKIERRYVIWVAWCDMDPEAPMWVPKQSLEVVSEGR